MNFKDDVNVKGKLNIRDVALDSANTKVLTIDDNGNVGYMPTSGISGGTGNGITVEIDTLQSVTVRGATSDKDVSFTGSIRIPNSPSVLNNAVWIGTSSATGSTNPIVSLLDELGDVNITTPTSGQALVFDGTNWINQNAQATGDYLSLSGFTWANLSGKPTIPTNNNQLTNGAGYITSFTEVDTLQSVTLRGATSDRNVAFNGSLAIPTAASALANTIWIGASTTTGSTNPTVSNLESLSDVTFNSLADGQGLVYNSTTGQWENKTVAAQTLTWDNITGKPTTIVGYGINDAVTIANTNQNILGIKTFFNAPVITTIGTANNNAVSFGQLMGAPNTIEFQRQFRTIPRIRVLTTATNKCKEFLRIVPANNYAHVRVSVVNQNSTIKNYEFFTGYDALSESTWSQLTPENIYKDRSEDFHIDIKKVSGFGPLNFGIILRYRNINPSGGSEAFVKLDFSLELPAVGTNYNQFDLLSTAEYTVSGGVNLYGRQLTFDSSYKNWTDTDGLTFLKSNALSGYATTTSVNTALGNYLPLSGGTITGNLQVNNSLIIPSIATATNNGIWIGVSSATGSTNPSVSNLDSLTDVIISGPTNGQALVYNGTTWVNTGIATGNGGAADSATKLATPRAINGVLFDGTAPITISANASDVFAWAKTSVKPSYTATEIGLGSVNNTADANKNVLSASKLTTARTINGVSFNGEGNITITAAASDVSAWAKAATKPSYTKAEVGLGSVDNTADANKTVKHATTAGSAAANDVYTWAKQPAKPSYSKSEVGLGNVDNTADANKSVSYANNAGNATTANSASLAGSVTINYNNTSNSNYQMLWGSGNVVYGGSGVTSNPATGLITATQLKATGRMTIPIGAPASPANGDIWIN